MSFASLLAVVDIIFISLLFSQGFIVAEKSPWFHIGFVSQFAEPDAIFDPNANGILSYIPGVLHSLMVFVMNQIIFRAIAEHLTEWENHCVSYFHFYRINIMRSTD